MEKPTPRLPMAASRYLPIALAYLIPAVVFFLVGFELRCLLAPGAGPFAAKLWGKTCGVSNAAPMAAATLFVVGGLSILAHRGWRQSWTLVPLILWWVAWVATAFLSMINVYA